MGCVVLFDIDGTLVDCGGVGRRSMQRAFADRYQRADACDAINFGGMTDRAIIRAGMTAIEAEISERAIDALIALYLRLLAAEIPHAERFRVLPGARELVALSLAVGHAVGLGTGNVRGGAQLKLERGGLWASFAFGGFGCDAEARAELLAVGRTRGASKLGKAPEDCKTLIVGDTPRDIAAAHAIGASCLAVTTGRFDEQQLRDAGATLVVDSLASDAARRAIEHVSAEA